MSSEPSSTCDCDPDLNAPLLATRWDCPNCGAQWYYAIQFRDIQWWPTGPKTKFAFEVWERRAVTYT